MSRLIDADKAIEWIDINYPKLDRQDMKQMLNAQPTAYDIDKVVKRLKQAAWSLGSDDVIEHYCVDLVDAIEIVKDGE